MFAIPGIIAAMWLELITGCEWTTNTAIGRSYWQAPPSLAHRKGKL